MHCEPDGAHRNAVEANIDAIRDPYSWGSVIGDIIMTIAQIFHDVNPKIHKDVFISKMVESLLARIDNEGGNINVQHYVTKDKGPEKTDGTTSEDS